MDDLQNWQHLPLNDLPEDISGERRLFAAVLYQHIADATSPSSRRELVMARDAAIPFITRPSADLQFFCDVLGLDMRKFIRDCELVIEHGREGNVAFTRDAA